MAMKSITFLMVFSYSVFVTMKSGTSFPVLREPPSSISREEYSIGGGNDSLTDRTSQSKFESRETGVSVRRRREFRSIFYKNFPSHKSVFRNSHETHRNNLKLSSSWGGGGMPFNALYIPNAHQQKMFKASSSSLTTKIEKPPLAQKDFLLLQEPSKQLPEVLDFVLEGSKSSKIKMEERFYKKPLTRKYYSSIPHFYVSYGW